MAPSSYFLLTAVLALATWQAIASDPSPLQDFCVADNSSRGMYSQHWFKIKYIVVFM
jgi:hypothetical protein